MISKWRGQKSKVKLIVWSIACSWLFCFSGRWVDIFYSFTPRSGQFKHRSKSTTLYNIAISYIITTFRNKIELYRIINFWVRFHYHVFLKLFLFHNFKYCIVHCIKIILKGYVNSGILFCKTFYCVIYQNALSIPEWSQIWRICHHRFDNYTPLPSQHK